jgi:hypothetical protein
MTSPPTLVLVSEVLPQRLRATGMAVTYYVAVAVFGGFAQLFSTALIHVTDSPNAPAFYLIGEPAFLKQRARALGLDIPQRLVESAQGAVQDRAVPPI